MCGITAHRSTRTVLQMHLSTEHKHTNTSVRRKSTNERQNEANDKVQHRAIEMTKIRMFNTTEARLATTDMEKNTERCDFER